ncbi:hypothetical protein ILUMI_17039, partial [Ignelater luminosus]
AAENSEISSNNSFASFEPHEALDELERDTPIVTNETITLPSDNTIDEITDEDSKGEDEVSIHNLPSSQLYGEAEITEGKR